VTESLHGRICLVTGANAGIGLETAKGLAVRGGRVILLCRDDAKGRAAVEEVGHDAELVLADLTDHDAVRAAADAVLARHDALHVLVNNAGAFSMERQLDAHGVEQSFSAGFLGHFLLTGLLRERLVASAPSRVIHVAGISHRKGALDLDDPWFGARPWDAWAANQQTQLARVVFAVELARRLEGTGVTSNAVHPGAVITGAQQAAPWWARLLIHTVLRPGFVRPPRGARPVVRLAARPELEGVTGRFFDRVREADVVAAARDEAMGERLWRFAQGLIDDRRGANRAS